MHRLDPGRTHDGEETTVELEYRPCRLRDVPVLDRLNPGPTVVSFSVQRFARHEIGYSTFLLAWTADSPVGHAEILWNGCRDDQVRRAHPDCPEITGLEVFPAALRGHGIGTGLIGACEDLARQRGYRRIGLGVAIANPRAADLYRRLGYRGDMAYRDRYSCVDSFGAQHNFEDPCVFLTRPLFAGCSDLCHRTNYLPRKSP